MSDFIGNMLKALFVIVNTLENISFDIYNVSISLLDLAEYSLIVSTILFVVRKISTTGLIYQDYNKNTEV